MTFSHRLAAACLLFMVATSSPGRAQTAVESLDLTVTATPALTTDYVFRGISQTRGRPAVQGTLDVEHASGFYLGAFASNIAFAGTDARQEIDLLAGYRFELAGFKFDLGGIYYAYPGHDRPPGGFRLDYVEAAARISREIANEVAPVRLLGALHVSPDFQAESGTGVYLEGGADLTLPLEFILSGRAGHQWIDRNTRFGTPDYLWWGAGVARPVFGFTLALNYYDTNLSRAECVGGQKICDARVVFSVSRTF